MKRILYIIIFLFLGSSVLLAQTTKEKSQVETVEAMKIAFITKRLDLSPAEAQAFWPLYNEYQKKIDEIRRSKRENTVKGKEDFEGMSDKEIEALLSNDFTLKQKELEVQKEYYNKFKAVLPMKKVALYYKAEEDFKKVLIEQLKKQDNK
jgi:hypothetical protein